MLKSISLAALAAAAVLVQPSIAGDWDMTYETPGGPRTYRVTLKTDGQALSGSVRRPTGDVPLTGETRGDSVFFSYDILYNDQPLTMRVAARLADSTMTGSIAFAGQMQERLTAVRVMPPR